MIVGLIIGSVLLFVTINLLFGYKKMSPYLNSDEEELPGSVAEKVFVDINGIKQGMFIQSKNRKNPVLLYLHGGLPEFFLTRKFPIGLEDSFTVIWWEQRGSGISYDSKRRAEKITLDQMISDTLEVTKYLRQRFDKEKIFLLGHSGGSFIAIQVAARVPELYHAYIGISQMSNQLESEVRAYNYMLKKFELLGKMNCVRKLKKAPVTLENGIPNSYLKLRDEFMHRLGVGTTHKMVSLIYGILIPSLTCRDYTFKERFNLWRGKSESGVAILWEQMISTDLSNKIPKINIPVYFFHGKFDYTISFESAKSYFESLKAPVKGFYIFHNSAHSPLFEEPEKAKIIFDTDIVISLNTLADIT